MVRIYGCSDDLVEIEGSSYKDNEIDCYDRDVIIRFSDGTVIRIGYNKPNFAVWYIIVENRGSAEQTLTVCEDEYADLYSDVFEINAEIIDHECVEQEGVS